MEKKNQLTSQTSISIQSYTTPYMPLHDLQRKRPVPLRDLKSPNTPLESFLISIYRKTGLQKLIRSLGFSRNLKAFVKEHGIYNQNLQAVPPTGSISYINNSTSSIHPIASQIEIRKEGMMGRVYYPAPYLTNDNREYFQDAYEIGPEKIIDIYAAAQQHVDQGLSLTLFFKDTATTRDINKAQIYAWRKGIKTIYYIRIRQQALQGTEMDNCVSCML
jgi:ribonucleotide reductase alpha subunit